MAIIDVYEIPGKNGGLDGRIVMIKWSPEEAETFEADECPYLMGNEVRPWEDYLKKKHLGQSFIEEVRRKIGEKAR
jgi:hypothetical protein